MSFNDLLNKYSGNDYKPESEGFVTGNLKKGGALAQQVAGGLARFVGAEETGQNIITDAKNDQAYLEAANPSVTWDQVNGIGSGAKYVAGETLKMLPLAGATAIGGIAGTMAAPAVGATGLGAAALGAAGAFIPSLATETGLISSEADKVDGNRGRIATAALPAAALDAVPAMVGMKLTGVTGLAKNIGRKIAGNVAEDTAEQAVKKGVVRQVAEGAGKLALGATGEAMTESAQSPLEAWGANKPVFKDGKQYSDDIIRNTVGAFTGGMIGGENYTPEMQQEMKESFYAGGAAGLGMGVGGKALSAVGNQIMGKPSVSNTDDTPQEVPALPEDQVTGLQNQSGVPASQDAGVAAPSSAAPVAPAVARDSAQTDMGDIPDYGSPAAAVNAASNPDPMIGGLTVEENKAQSNTLSSLVGEHARNANIAASAAAVTQAADSTIPGSTEAADWQHHPVDDLLRNQLVQWTQQVETPEDQTVRQVIYDNWDNTAALWQITGMDRNKALFDWKRRKPQATAGTGVTDLLQSYGQPSVVPDSQYSQFANNPFANAPRQDLVAGPAASALLRNMQQEGGGLDEERRRQALLNGTASVAQQAGATEAPLPLNTNPSAGMYNLPDTQFGAAPTGNTASADFQVQGEQLDQMNPQSLTAVSGEYALNRQPSDAPSVQTVTPPADVAPGAANIFIRPRSKNETQATANSRALAAIPDKEGYDKVYKPYGDDGQKSGAGYYYVPKSDSNLTEQQSIALDPAKLTVGEPVEVGRQQLQKIVDYYGNGKMAPADSNTFTVNSGTTEGIRPDQLGGYADGGLVVVRNADGSLTVQVKAAEQPRSESVSARGLVKSDAFVATYLNTVLPALRSAGVTPYAIVEDMAYFGKPYREVRIVLKRGNAIVGYVTRTFTDTSIKIAMIEAADDGNGGKLKMGVIPVLYPAESSIAKRFGVDLSGHFTNEEVTKPGFIREHPTAIFVGNTGTVEYNGVERFNENDYDESALDSAKASLGNSADRAFQAFYDAKITVLEADNVRSSDGPVQGMGETTNNQLTEGEEGGTGDVQGVGGQAPQTVQRGATDSTTLPVQDGQGNVTPVALSLPKVGEAAKAKGLHVDFRSGPPVSYGISNRTTKAPLQTGLTSLAAVQKFVEQYQAEAVVEPQTETVPADIKELVDSAKDVDKLIAMVRPLNPERADLMQQYADSIKPPSATTIPNTATPSTPEIVRIRTVRSQYVYVNKADLDDPKKILMKLYNKDGELLTGKNNFIHRGNLDMTGEAPDVAAGMDIILAKGDKLFFSISAAQAQITKMKIGATHEAIAVKGGAAIVRNGITFNGERFVNPDPSEASEKNENIAIDDVPKTAESGIVKTTNQEVAANDNTTDGGTGKRPLESSLPGTVPVSAKEREAGKGSGSVSRVDDEGNGNTDEGGNVRSGSLASQPESVHTLPGKGTDGSAARPSGVTTPSEPRTPQLKGDNPGNYRITAADDMGGGTRGQKIAANLAAIRLVKQLDNEGRYPTRAEQAVLVKYVGWGGLKSVFDPNSTKPQDQKARTELEQLLTEAEYFDARSSILNAHYTSPEIIGSIYKMLDHMGFKGGNVLEPTYGSGNFIGLMPEQIAASSKWYGSELDPVTSKIGKYLYPDAQLIESGFQKAEFPYGKFDLAIGNPPFGSEQITDTNKKRSEIDRFKIHNYVIAKSGMHLRPGGVMAMVVTSRFMDTDNPEARDYLAQHFKFLTAIRLPNDAFAKNAGTEVTTDLVFFQKLMPGETADLNADWLNVNGHMVNAAGEDVYMNEWFASYPHLMLGEPSMKGTMYGGQWRKEDGKGEFTLNARTGQDTTAEFYNLFRDKDNYSFELLRDLFKPTPATADAAAVSIQMNREDIGIGGYIEENGEILMRGDDDQQGNPVFIKLTADTPWTEKQTLGQTRLSRIKGMMAMREAAYKLIEAERFDLPDMEAKRKELNKLYDTFVSKHGLLSDSANATLMADDVKIESGLEVNYRKAISAAKAKTLGVKPQPAKADKAAIMQQRVFFPTKEITSAANARDGYGISLSERGRLDLEYIAGLTGQTTEEVIKELADEGLIYKDPATGTWKQEDEYLSGNVKAKLSKVLGREGYEKNVEALTSVLPKDVTPEEIFADLGATWIPAYVYKDFAELMGIANANVVIIPEVGTVKINGSAVQNDMNVMLQNNDHDVASLINHIAAKQAVVAYDHTSDGKRIVNKDRTKALIPMVKRVSATFRDWLMADPARAKQLTQLYNDTMNTHAPRTHNGKHLKTVGASPAVRLRNHQRNAAWRMLQSPVVMLDHIVGSGKTFTVITGVMERKRLGLSNKSMIVVPNHLVGQWGADFLKLYPGARILATTEKDFATANRKRLFARIATGNYDAVIVGHSSFGFIPLEAETNQQFMMEEVSYLERALRTAKDAGGNDKRLIRNLVLKIARKQERIKNLMNKERDDVITFESMGIDNLVVDESHEFKNLEYSTSMQNITGMGNPQGAKKSFDLYAKIQYLRSKDGAITFATGTPISNSLVEMYTILRYLNRQGLKDRNLDVFDSWAKSYASIESRIEYTASQKLKDRQVMATFNNLPELLQLYSEFADVISMKDLKRIYAEQIRESNQDTGANEREEFPIPKVKSGARYLDVADPTQSQRQYMDYLVARANRLEKLGGGNDPRVDNHLWLMNDARKMALDIRLVDPSAPSDPNNKVNRAANNIKRIYDQWDSDKGAQLVFCDLSTPAGSSVSEADTFIKSAKVILGMGKDKALANVLSDLSYTEQWTYLKNRIEREIERIDQAEQTDSNEAAREKLEKFLESVGDEDISTLNTVDTGFSVYDDLKATLIDMGIPASEIRFIHEANTRDQKTELFSMVNSGMVRVLIGSSRKMGAGTNAQERLVALHHMDAPWRPSDVEQREGRIIRQGNMLYERDPDNFEVEIPAYSTRNTFDSVSWQILARKAEMLEDFRSGARTMQDSDSDAASYSEFMAESTGNPIFREKFKLEREIEELESTERNIMARRAAGERISKNADADIAKSEKALQSALQEMADVKDAKSFDVDGKKYANDLTEALSAANQKYLEAEREYKEKLLPGYVAEMQKLEEQDLDDKAKREAKKLIKKPVEPTKPNLSRIEKTSQAARAALRVSEMLDEIVDRGEVEFYFGGTQIVIQKVPAGNGIFDFSTYINGNGRWGLSANGLKHMSQQKLMDLFATGEIVSRVAADLRVARSNADSVKQNIEDAQRTLAKLKFEDSDKLKAMQDRYNAVVDEVNRLEAEMDTKREAESNSYIGNDASRFGAESKDAPTTKYSVGNAATGGQSATALRAAFNKIVNWNKLEDTGIFRVVQSVDQLPGDARAYQDIKGVFATDGQVYFVANNIKPGEEKGLLLHEIGVHYGLQEMLGDKVFNSVMQQLKVLKRTSKVAQDAYKRVPEGTRPEYVDEEALGYLIETKPDTPFVKRIISAIKAFLFKNGFIDAKHLNENDLLELAKASLSRVDREAGKTMGTAPKAALASLQERLQPFYSQLEKVIGQKMGGRMQFYQLKSMLKSNSVTDDEIDMLVGEFSNKPIVTKQEVMGAITANSVEFKDVVLGNKYRVQLTGGSREIFNSRKEAEQKIKEEHEWIDDESASVNDFDDEIRVIDHDGNVIAQYDYNADEDRWEKSNDNQAFDDERGESFENKEDALSDAEDVAEEVRAAWREEVSKEPEEYGGSDAAHFSEYTEPGSVDGSYREMFVTAPGVGTYQAGWDYYGTGAGSRGEFIHLGRYKNEDEARNKSGIKEGFERSETKTEYGSTFSLMHKIKPAVEKIAWEDGHSQYKEISNPVVRIRFNDREVDGKRILFVEEMQGASDANQQKMPEYLRKRIYDIGVKRVLAYAKDNGYDGISWTTGEMQAKRYDLSKQISKIEAHKVPQAGYAITATSTSNNIVIDDVFTAEKLPEVVGKDLAQKIINDIEDQNVSWEVSDGVYRTSDGIYEIRPNYSSYNEYGLFKNGAVAGSNDDIDSLKAYVSNQNNRKTYSDLDLKVGGEGLRSLYDRTLPALFKKYGKEKVGEVGINTNKPSKYKVFEVSESFAQDGKRWLLQESQDGEGKYWRDKDFFATKKEAVEASRRAESSVPYIPITSSTPASYPKFSVAKQNTLQPTAIPDQQRIEKAITGKSATEVLQYLIDNAPNFAYELIATRAKQAIKKSGAPVGFTITHIGDSVPSELINRKGSTDLYHSGKIEIRVNGVDTGEKSGMDMNILLHEFVHAATIGAIDNPTPVTQQAIKDIEAIGHAIASVIQRKRNSGQSLNIIEQRIYARDINALEDVDELLTWGLTIPEFQNYLESIPHKSGSLWSWFVSAVRSLMGLPARADTALSTILKAADTILDNPMAYANRNSVFGRGFMKTQHHSDIVKSTGMVDRQAPHDIEYADIEARYFNPDGSEKPGAMLAPNGKRSNLNKRQWIQVRTESFKKWFGAHIENAALDSILQKDFSGRPPSEMMDSVSASILNSQILDSVVSAIPVDVVDNFGGEKLAANAILNNPSVFIDVSSVGRADSSVIRDFSRFVSAAETVIAVSRAKLAFAKPTHSNAEALAAVDALQNNLIFLSAWAADGKATKSPVGGRIINHTLLNSLTITGLGTKPSVFLASGKFDPAEFTNSFHVNDYKLDWGHVQEKSSASKVVDANGEPMVVYHGTKSSFDAFRRDKIELDDAFFFTTSPQNAGEYAGSFGELQGDGGNIMPVFLNIREVNRYSNKEWLSNEGKEPADYSDFEGGVIIDQDGGNTYLVTNPTQIKSATGNTGAFDGSNPDIRYSLAQGDENNSGLQNETITPAKNVSAVDQMILDNESDNMGVPLEFVDVKGENSDAVREIAEKFGLRVRFYQADVFEGRRGRGRNGADEGGTNGRRDIPSGFTHPSAPGVLFIHTEATSHAFFVLGHEISHAIEDTDPEVYQYIISKLAPLVDIKMLIHRADLLKQQGAYTDLEYLGHLKELIADLTGEMFVREGSWDALANTNPSIFAKLAEAFIKILKKLKKFAIPDVPVSEVFTDLHTAKTVILIALNEYAKSHALSKDMQEFVKDSSNNQDVRYSLAQNTRLTSPISDAIDYGRQAWGDTTGTGLVKGILNLLNPLDWSRARQIMEEISPDSFRDAMGNLFATPAGQAERDSDKKPFFDVGLQREKDKMHNILAFEGYEGTATTENFLQRFKSTYTQLHNTDKSTKWGKVWDNYNHLTDKQRGAVDMMLVQGDARGLVYKTLAGAMQNKAIANAGTDANAFEVYQQIRNHIDTVVVEARIDMMEAFATESGMPKEVVAKHIADYRKRLGELPGWLPRNHGEGRHQVNVYHIVEDLKWQMKDLENNRRQAYLPYYPDKEVVKSIKRLARDHNKKALAEIESTLERHANGRLKNGAGAKIKAYLKDNGMSMTELERGNILVTGRTDGLEELAAQSQQIITDAVAKNQANLDKLKTKYADAEAANASSAKLREIKSQIDAATDTRIRVKRFMRLHETPIGAKKTKSGLDADMKKHMPLSHVTGEKYETEYRHANLMTEAEYSKLSGDFAMEQAQMAALKRAVQSGDISEEDYQAARDAVIKGSAEVLLGRGAGKYQIGRIAYLVEGYDTTDTATMYHDYMTSTAGMISKAAYAKEQMENYRYAPASVKPWAFKYVSDSLRNMGLGDRISGHARMVASFWYLGFKAASAVVNFTQPWTLGVAELGRRTKQNSVKAIFNAQRDIISGKLSASEKELFNSEIMKLQEMETAVHEMTGASDSKGMQMMHTLTNKAMMPFQEVEMLNRKTMILAAYRSALADGMAKPEAVEFALDVNRKTNFEMSRANLPGFARNPFGRTLYALQSFVWNNWNWIYSRATSGEKKDMVALLKYAGMLSLIGGATALAGGDEADKLYRRMFGRSIKMDLQQFTKKHLHEYGTPGELLHAFVWNGGMGVAGINISNSIRLNVPLSGWVTGETSASESALGVFAGLGKKASSAGTQLMKGNVTRAVESAAPEFISGPMRAYRQYAEGATTSHGKPVYDENGKQLKYSGLDSAKRMLGFQPMEQSHRMDVANTQQKLQAYWNEERQDILDQIRVAKDAKEFSEALKEKNKWNTKLKESQMNGLVTPITPQSIKNARISRPDKKKVSWLQANM